jgi:hypothetical protein
MLPQYRQSSFSGLVADLDRRGPALKRASRTKFWTGLSQHKGERAKKGSVQPSGDSTSMWAGQGDAVLFDLSIKCRVM